MAKEAATQNHAPRERHLNVVYFIDSSRTHSIRINLSHARWILAGAIGLTLWAVMSLVWILSLDRILDTTRSHLSTALASVFDYQVKYDKIFDLAYPDAAQHGYYAEGSHLSSNNPTAANEEKSANTVVASRDAAKEKEPAAANVPAMATVVNNNAAPPVVSALPYSTAPSVKEKDKEKEKEKDKVATSVVQESTTPLSSIATLDIRKPLLRKSGDKLSLEFDMINRESKNKSEGYVWAIVNLNLGDGSQKSLVAPASARLNKSGAVENQTSAYRFSIQRYKKKDFAFSLPAGNDLTISEVKIVYSDLSGKDRHESIVPPVIDKSEAAAEEKDSAP